MQISSFYSISVRWWCSGEAKVIVELQSKKALIISKIMYPSTESSRYAEFDDIDKKGFKCLKKVSVKKKEIKLCVLPIGGQFTRSKNQDKTWCCPSLIKNLVWTQNFQCFCKFV
jgi:hypothetical protein